MDNKADLKIIEQIKAGQSEAFNKLVEKYQYNIYKIIARFVYDNNDILDITQEVLIKIYKALPKFRGDSAFYTWMYRIAVNTAKNHLIAQNRKLPTIEFQDEEREELFFNKNTPTDIASPEHLLLRDEIAANLHDEMNGMADELRTAMLLREVEGKSYDEIAGIMACPVGTVRSRIHRARSAVDGRVNPFLQR